MSLPRSACLFALVGVVGAAHAASFDARVEALFRPPLGEMMALSPEGLRVAYTTQVGGDLRIVVMNLEHAGAKQTVKVNRDRESELAADQPPMRLRFLRWGTASRLVFAPATQVIPLPPVVGASGGLVPNPDGPTIIAPILAVDANGNHRGTLVDARDFQDTPEDARKTLADLLRTTKELVATRNEPVRWKMPHLDILGFFPGDREQLIIQTRGGYGRPAQHMVDIRTGSVREFGGNWPPAPVEPQVFDWFRLKVVGERKPAARPTTAWVDDELARVQQELELKFPRRIVEIMDWNETRARVLFRVTGGSDPGRFFVFQRPENLALEILRTAPWLGASKLNDTRFFECEGAGGVRLSGYLTWPGKPRVDPPSLLVVFPSGFPGRAQPAFDPEAQVLADLGFAVARLNHRSVAGLKPEDLTALRTAVDRVSVDDARVAVEWLATRNAGRPIDLRRVATLGRGFGGYLAVRALQLQPAVFRGGVAIDAPMDLRTWLKPADAGAVTSPAPADRDVPAALLDHDGADWKKLSVLEQAEAVTNPLLLLVEPGRSSAIDVSTDALRTRLNGLGRAPDYFDLDPGFAAAQPESRVIVYRRIEEFFNLRFPDAAAKPGVAAEVK